MADWPALKNASFTLTFPIYDNDGDLVSGATAADSEVSKDGASFADATNEVSEIDSSGMYTLVLTATEMNADVVTVITKTTTPNAKTAVNVVYTAARQIKDLAYPAVSGRSMDVDANGGLEVGSFQTGAITSGAFAADAITNSVLAASAITEIQTGLSTLDAAGVRTAVGLASANLDTQLGAIDDFLDTEVAAILADTNELQTDWTDGGRLDLILDARASQTSVDTIDDFLDTEIAAILADTNELQTDLVNGGRLDLLIDAILADTNELQGDWTNGGRLDLLVDAILDDTGTSGVALATATLNSIADALLARDIDNVEASAAIHSLTGAILKAVSKIEDDAGTLKVYQTNGSTLFMSQALTTDANNEPIDSVGVAS